MNARWLVIAIALTISLLFFPFAQIITYPFLIFSTFVHETAHAVAALLTGGTVESLIVRIDGSGITYTRGGSRLIVSSAGYIGTTLFGAFLLILSHKQSNVRRVLSGTALFVLIITALFVGYTNNLVVLSLIAAIAVLVGTGARRLPLPNVNRTKIIGGAFALLIVLLGYLLWTKSLFSWSAGLLISSVLIGVARFGSIRFAHFFLTFLAVQCSLNALDGIKTLYFISLRSSCGNDAATMASLTGIPAWIWAVFWAALSFFILAISAAMYARKTLRTSPVPA
jgi:hypothetical protein